MFRDRSGVNTPGEPRLEREGLPINRLRAARAARKFCDDRSGAAATSFSCRTGRDGAPCRPEFPYSIALLRWSMQRVIGQKIALTEFGKSQYAYAVAGGGSMDWAIRVRLSLARLIGPTPNRSVVSSAALQETDHRGILPKRANNAIYLVRRADDSGAQCRACTSTVASPFGDPVRAGHNSSVGSPSRAACKCRRMSIAWYRECWTRASPSRTCRGRPRPAGHYNAAANRALAECLSTYGECYCRTGSRAD